LLARGDSQGSAQRCDSSTAACAAPSRRDPPPNATARPVTDWIVSLMTGLGPLALVILLVVAFAETGLLIGFLIPGDTVVFTAGVLMAAGVISTPIWLALLGVALAAMAGDQMAYFVGRHFGPRVLNRPKSRLLSPRHIGAAARFFERHGPKAVVLARFVPVARTMTPVLAGVGTMTRRRFTSYNLVGAAAWTLVILGGGFLFGGIPFVATHVGAITLGVAGVSVLPLLVTAGRRHRSRPATAPAQIIPVATRLPETCRAV
jgi:membrane-associated protein